MPLTHTKFFYSCQLMAAWFCANASGLTIIPTFEGAGYTPAVRLTVEDALETFALRFRDEVTVHIRFLDSGMLNGSVGRTTQDFWTVDYSVFLTALRGDRLSVDDAAALAGLPAGTGAGPVPGQLSPVPGTNDKVWLTRPHAVALGLSVPATEPDSQTRWDAVIDLDLAHMFHDRAAPDPAKYDLRGTVLHEVAEVLGTTSNLADFSPQDLGIRPVDLFRYAADGSRSYTRAGDDAWFSLNGLRKLARFNQDAGGDYADFWSPGDPAADQRPFQVQDAFNWPGLMAEMQVELRMLDVVGYDPVLPPVAPPELLLLADGDAALTFHAVPFQDYKVERSVDLKTWSILGTYAADRDGVLALTDEDAPPARAFYRATGP